MKKRKSIEENFFSRVEKDGPQPDVEKYPRLEACWVWKGFLWRGYGKLRVSSSKMVRAHRVSWMIHNGDIPNGLHVLHRCDNPGCVNPSHLFLGSHGENMKDCALKGRAKSGRAKLNEMQVRLARRTSELRIPSSYMGKIFGVTRGTIDKAVRRYTWVRL